MKSYLQAVYQAITEVSAHELVGGLLVGLALSLVVSGVWMLVRKKVADPLPMLCGLILTVSALSMAFGLGHSRYQSELAKHSLWTAGPNPRGDVVPPLSLGRRLLQDADANRDGHLTPDEAAQFVRDADHAGKGWASIPEIDRNHQGPAGKRPLSDFHPASTRRGVRHEGL